MFQKIGNPGRREEKGSVERALLFQKKHKKKEPPTKTPKKRLLPLLFAGKGEERPRLLPPLFFPDNYQPPFFCLFAFLFLSFPFLSFPFFSFPKTAFPGLELDNPSGSIMDLTMGWKECLYFRIKRIIPNSLFFFFFVFFFTSLFLFFVLETKKEKHKSFSFPFLSSSKPHQKKRKTNQKDPQQ